MNLQPNYNNQREAFSISQESSNLLDVTRKDSCDSWVHYLSNPSFIEVCEYLDCRNQHFLACAGFIDYIIERKSTDQAIHLSNLGFQLLLLGFGVGELMVAIRAGSWIAYAIGAYTIAGDIYSISISSSGFLEYIMDEYPEDWEEYLEILNMVSILHGVTSSGMAVSFQLIKTMKATRFIGEVEALQWNPSKMESLTQPEVKSLQITRQHLLDELYVLRKNNDELREIIDNEISFWRNYRNLSISNARRGTSAEWNAAKLRIQNVRSELGIPNTERNLSFFDGTIDGYPGVFDNLLDPSTGKNTWKSLKTSITEESNLLDFEADNINVFTALTTIKEWRRNMDSEFRMLNYLIKQLKPGATQGDIFTDVTGTIIVASERTYCISCATSINMFNQMFPNINLILIDGIIP